MLITFELRDEDARELQAAGVDLARRAKEALLAALPQRSELNDGANGLDREGQEPYDPGNAWELLGEDVHEGFAANGLTRADFEDAVRGIRPPVCGLPPNRSPAARQKPPLWLPYCSHMKPTPSW